jgi:glycosyl transferase family 87
VIGPAALLALAAVTIALALQISSGQYDPRAVALVTLATVAAVIGATWRKRVVPVREAVLPQALLGVGCAAGLACHLFTNPTFYADPRALQGGFRWLALIALAVLSAYLWHLRPSLIRARFPLLLACFAAMGLLVIRASPKPWIDVWVFQQGAADAVLHGANPYSVSYQDIYGPMALAWYAPELRQAGRVVAYPYPPLTFLAEAPAFAAFGDVRYALLASMIGAAWLIARAAPGKLGELAAALVLFQPRTLLVVEQAWTEPLVLFCFALSVYAIVRGAHWALSGAALGLLAASKQYAVLFVVPLALSMPRRRGLWVAATVVIAVLAPFAIGDPAGFWRSVIRFQLLQPFRMDSLSLAPFAARLFGPAVQPFALAGLALGAGVLAFCLRRHPDLPLACATAAAAWAAVLIWNKQSFCNYWWLCSGLLAAASAAPAARETG